MKSRTVITEIAAAGALIGSYPLDWVVRRGEPYFCEPSSEPVILLHGFGGSRANLLALAAYLRLAGFDNVSYFEYPRWQTLTDSAAQLGRVADGKIRGQRRSSYWSQPRRHGGAALRGRLRRKARCARW